MGNSDSLDKVKVDASGNPLTGFHERAFLSIPDFCEYHRISVLPHINPLLYCKANNPQLKGKSCTHSQCLLWQLAARERKDAKLQTIR